MQDGRFQHDDQMLGIGKAIFVFAGGIASTHKEFSSAKFWAKRNGGRPGSDIFTASKGPDFHSRLRGFLDILGPNPKLLRGDPKADEGTKRRFDRFSSEDFSFVVRRAVLIRQFIERMQRDLSVPLLDVEDAADMDKDLLDALLLTDSYKHGVRSLQAIFEMSSIQGERALAKTALPSKGQYSMHVDPSFTNILVRDYESLASGILKGVLMRDLGQPYLL